MVINKRLFFLKKKMVISFFNDDYFLWNFSIFLFEEHSLIYIFFIGYINLTCIYILHVPKKQCYFIYK